MVCFALLLSPVTNSEHLREGKFCGLEAKKTATDLTSFLLHPKVGELYTEQGVVLSV